MVILIWNLIYTAFKWNANEEHKICMRNEIKDCQTSLVCL